MIERFDTLFLAGNKKVLTRLLVSPFAPHESVLAGVRTAFVYYCPAAITCHLSTSTKSNHVIFLALLLFWLHRTKCTCLSASSARMPLCPALFACLPSTQ